MKKSLVSGSLRPMVIGRMLTGLALLYPVVPSLIAGILTGSTGSHDPSRMIACNGNYYIYSTGGGMKYSADRLNWTAGTSPFNGVPTSVKNLLPSNQGIWAPDVIFYNDKYYLYYSVAASSGATPAGTAIGLLTSPTLDPSVSGYKWTDVGVVISDSDKADKRSSIDPCPFTDANSDLWLSYGSGYANGATWSDPTIFIVKLDNTTGLASTTNTVLYPVALGHIEASYVYYHAGYYYAFWNSGGCCDGATSTYTIHMARSPTVTGTYVDKNGVGNSSVTFLASTVVKNSVDGNEHGPGHIGILSENGIDRCTYHYYPDSGGSVIGEETIVWGADGWPVAGTDFVPGTYKITSAATGQAVGVRGAITTDGAPLELETYTASTYQKWTVAFTYSSGTTADGYYSIASAGSAKMVDLYQSSAVDGTLIEQWTPGTGNNQRWFVEQTSDGKYRVVSRSSGDVIAVPTNSQTPVPTLAKTNGGADVQVSFPSQLGWNYSLADSPDLRNWTSLSTFAGTGKLLSYTDSGVGAYTPHFWRINIQQALNSWTWFNVAGQEWNLSPP